MIRLTEDQGRLLLQRLSSQDGSIASIALLEVEQAISQQLNAPQHFDDLIDTIVKVVQDPRSSSLSRDHTSLLRRSLLSPLELVKFKSLADRGVSCITCERTLKEGEVATRNGRGVACYHCRAPESVYCPTCRADVDVYGLHKIITRILQRHVCAAPPMMNDIPTSRADLSFLITE